MADVEEAQDILKSLGMPPAQHNAMAGMTLIALCGLTPNAPWSVAQRRRCTVTKGIMDYLEEHYGTNYAPNTRETFRRQVLHQFVQGGIADYNPFDPRLPTNSPNAHYAVTESVVTVVRCYGEDDWEAAVDRFRQEQGALVDRYARIRDRNLIPVKVPDGRELQLSPGKHNEVQRAIVEEFAPRFAPGAHLLYLGDTAKKNLFVDKDRLADLCIPDHRSRQAAGRGSLRRGTQVALSSRGSDISRPRVADTSSGPRSHAHRMPSRTCLRQRLSRISASSVGTWRTSHGKPKCGCVILRTT